MKTKREQTPKTSVLILLAFLMFGISSLRAQILIPATSYENNFPGGPPSGQLPTCYSYANINFGGTPYDAYLSAVDGQLIWRMTLPASPSSIFNQGFLSYPGCVDMNVGFMEAGVPMAIVAYYLTGVGHFYDVYKWTTSGLSLISSTPLSTLSSYSRISIDSHKTYGMVIVWEDATDIYAVTGLSGAFTTPILLGGTTNLKRPDVAFSHTPAGLNVHFVYNKQTSPTSYKIIESVADFYLLNSSGGFYTPTIQDVNPVTVMWSELTASIDCPDHYSVENWAYTYAIDGVDIYTRSIDFNTTGIPVTTNLVNGSLGNNKMWGKELRPRIAYNQSCTSFHVAWYSSFSVGPNGQCYFSEQIKESAAGLVSSPDYELIAANSAFPPGASLNSVAFSKQNDASYFLYTIFLDATGVNHKFHKWPLTTSFRGGDNSVVNTLKESCFASPESNTSVGKNEMKQELLLGPNPFSKDLNLFVPESLKDQTVHITLMDITGKLLLQYEGTGKNASEALGQATKNLSAGSYFVSTKMDKTGIQQNFKVLKTNNTN